MNNSDISIIKPDWPAPNTIKALTSTRLGGVSQAPYESLNLAEHVGDKPQAVAENRVLLAKEAILPSAVGWLNQTHSDVCVNLSAYKGSLPINADASIANTPEQVCAVMTADCVPVLLCNSAGAQVAAIHAGWRGLFNQIIGKTLRLFDSKHAVMAWIGPSIRQRNYQVSEELQQRFVEQDAGYEAYFQLVDHHWYADLAGIATRQLKLANVAVFDSNLCTFEDPRFFSYRRDEDTGRMASFIWIAKS